MEKEVEKFEGKPVYDYYDVVSDEEIGRSLNDGDVIIITGVSIDKGRFGELVVFDTPEGKRYSGAIAIVDFALRLIEHPEYMPVRVKVAEVTSALGRRYLRFTQA